MASLQKSGSVLPESSPKLPVECRSIHAVKDLILILRILAVPPLFPLIHGVDAGSSRYTRQTRSRSQTRWPIRNPAEWVFGCLSVHECGLADGSSLPVRAATNDWPLYDCEQKPKKLSVGALQRVDLLIMLINIAQ